MSRSRTSLSTRSGRTSPSGTRQARRRRSVPLAALTAVALAAATAGLAPTAVASTGRTATATGGPGALSHFDLARKDCLGTARNTTSKVWFTVAGGVLSDVYYPTIDTTEVETMQLVVTDGRTFTDLQTRDTTYTVRALDRSGMACEVTSSAKSGRYRIVTDYLTDPARDSVVVRTRLVTAPGDRLDAYVRFDPTVNGNGGGGTGNGGADDAVTDTSTGTPVPVASDVVTSTNAANRDYGVPVYAALRADRPFRAVTNGYVGTASDGLTQLDASHALTTLDGSALHGNVVQTAELDLRHGAATLALGFGTTQAGAVATAGASARAPFERTLERYQEGWQRYDDSLRRPPAAGPGTSAAQRAVLASTYYVSADVLKASEDKTFPGAIAASMSSPWGQAVSAGDPANTYFGSYREVFARDLYETFTGLLADGDRATAVAATRFLLDKQQQADGSIPRNSLLNGKAAPDTFGVQLDEVAYPILMARTVGLTDMATYRDHIKKAADFIVAHGPSFGSERWEEQSGYSPSTIAAEIAGLLAASTIADRNGDHSSARVYRGTADDYQRSIKTWDVTTNGPYSTQPYFIRLSKNGDASSAYTYNLGNGGPDADQRAVIDQGFLELARLGELAATDADITRSLGVVDSVIAGTTSSGTGFYRYGTSSAGTEDGYGDCNVGDPTSCTVQGKPWAGVCGSQAQNQGSGHLWPALSGERAEYDIAVGDTATARSLWAEMANTASGVGLIPEQAWENADLAPSPYGTAPECASIGFTNGKAAGSASPLTWSAAQYVRLADDLRRGAVAEQPKETAQRYVQHTQAATTVTLTAPVDQSLVTGSTTVTGTTAAGAVVDVQATNVDIDGSSTSATTTAAADGSFSVTLPVPAGTDTVTVAATAPGGATGFAQRTVVWDVVPGTLVYGTTDPSGDDNGPGTYAYPTAADFHPGAYDMQQFQVYDSGTDAVTFRVQTADLTPTFGSPLGAQLVDVYIHNPSGGPTSTAPAHTGRNYTIAASSAWNRLIEVQGFGQAFVDGTGATVGPVSIRANAVTRWITFTVSKTALGGTPSTGWTMAVVLTGQDGFSPDQARGFTQPAQGYQFGVCTAAAVAASNPICAVDPTTVPKAMDVLTPTGVSQADELDPTKHSPVTVAGVTLP